jgi:hypothetical protein
VEIYIFLDVVFSVIAALVAFLIAYGEYARHYATKTEPLKLAFRTAGFAFIVFLVLGMFAAIMLHREISKW